ncbi:MAG TPA: tetratricopeptide repeat protein, partial [Longimicrobiales bacterium]|nr:tetratricopeptide repeat protein [Longimicrobiales bacterium]
ALDPGYTFARLAFAVCLQDQARFQEAVEQLESARAADPLALHVHAVLGRVFVNARSPERAIPVLLEAMEIAPELDLVHQQLGHAYLQTGESGKAIRAFETAAQLSGVRDSAHLSYAYAAIGEHAESRRLLDTVLHVGEHHNVLSFHVAMVYAALGQPDDAFHWLDRGYNERASFMDGVMVTPAFDPLHNDPRWGSLLRKMNLVP